MELTLGIPFLDQGDLKSLIITKCVGEHSLLEARVGYAEADLPDNPAGLIGTSLSCQWNDNDNPTDLFYGIVTYVELVRNPSIGIARTVRVLAHSGSIRSDLIPRCRVFQNPQATLADVVNRVFAQGESPGECSRGDFSWPVPLTVQYQETDFHYLKRILTAAGIALVVDDCRDRLLAGHPMGGHHALQDKDIVGDAFTGTIAPLLSEESYATADGLAGEFQNACSRFADQLGERAPYIPSSAHTQAQKNSQNRLSVRDASDLVLGTAQYRVRTHRSFMAVGDQVQVRQEETYTVVSSRVTYKALPDDQTEFFQDYFLSAVHELYPASEPQKDIYQMSWNDSAPQRKRHPDKMLYLDVPWRTTTFMAEVIKNSGDPEKLGRVQVRFDWENEEQADDNQCWVDVMTPYAGQDDQTYGFLMLPEIGEKVLVRFLEPWDDKPLVVGSLRRGKVVDNLDTGQHKIIGTPGGNRIDLVSDQNRETIRLRAGQSEEFHFVLETSEGRTRATLCCNDSLRLNGKNIVIEGESIDINSKTWVNISCDKILSLTSQSGTKLTSRAGIKIKGSLVEIN